MNDNHCVSGQRSDGDAEPVTKPVAGTGDDRLGPQEIGGRQGPEPTRYGDWEKNGRCIDF